MNFYNLKKLNSNTFIIEIEVSKISKNKQKELFGKAFNSVKNNGVLEFFQKKDYIFSIDTLIYLELDLEFRLLAKGKYPLKINDGIIQITNRSAWSSFLWEFSPKRNASKATVGRTSCECNDGFTTSA